MTEKSTESLTVRTGGYTMYGIRHFRDCCKTMKLDCDSLFQLGQCGTTVSQRLTHRFDHHKRKDSHIFAVCYVKQHNLYVAWSLKAKKANHKSVFTLKWSEVDLLFNNAILPIKKSIEFSGHGEELVRVFTPDMVPEFLTKYCSK